MSESTFPKQICTRCVLTNSFPRIRFDDKGVCSICREYDQWSEKWHSTQREQQQILQKLCKQAKGKHKEFDALVPLSGGKDSTYVLYVAQQELGLNCLTYTLDNGYLSEHAKDNINKACKKLGVEHIYYRLNPELANKLFALFIRKTGWFCSVCMRAIQMSTFRIAEMYKVPLIIKGTSFRTELPLTREMFQGGDPDHVRRVLEGENITQECRRLSSRGASLQRQLGFMLFLLFGKKRLVSSAYINLPDYVEWNYDVIQDTLRKELDWTAPTKSEHMDCIIHPIQRYIHDRRFPDLDMRRLTFARFVMAGFMTRDEALRKLEDDPREQCPEAIMNLFLNNIQMTKKEFDSYVDMGPRHLQYHPEPSLALRIAKKIFSFRDAGEY
jgi:N-acetyl sugar amidotransferase